MACFVTARDRFTLQPRWSVRPVSDEGSVDPWAARRASVAGRLIEDTCNVTVYGQILIATMGIAQNGDRDGDPGTFAIDCRSGRVMWSVVPTRLDPQLEGSTVRGPALVDGGTVILGARKQAQGRRITSFYLFGVALDTGKLQWVRPAGSAGAIPWGRGEQRVHPAAILNRGIVYAVDPLGVIIAVGGGERPPRVGAEASGPCDGRRAGGLERALDMGCADRAGRAAAHSVARPLRSGGAESVDGRSGGASRGIGARRAGVLARG
jgi:outer membrane protein assembly factor BamB